MSRTSILISLSLCLALSACGTTPNRADVLVADVDVFEENATKDLPATTDLPTDSEPFVVGPPPPCTLLTFARHVADQNDNVVAYEPGGIVRIGAGFVVAVRQAVSRGGTATRRDVVDAVVFGPDGSLLSIPTLYDSTTTMTDLSLPSVVRADDGALVLVRESRGLQGMPGFTTQLRVARIDSRGTLQSPTSVIDNRGDPFAASLPDGTALVLSPRVVAMPGGNLVAASNVLRMRPDATVFSAVGVDLTSIIPIEADSVFMRSFAMGAAAVFRRGVDVQTVRFDAMGLVDTQTYITRNVDATRIDDVAVFPQGIVAAWDEPQGMSHTIRVLVARPDGRLILNAVLERFMGSESPVVSVASVHYGAAITWVRGSGATAMLRGAVMQPNGVLRGVAQDLVAIPNADGRLVTVGDGLALTFAARDQIASIRGLTVGRLCLR
jgi:hypothetical protein